MHCSIQSPMGSAGAVVFFFFPPFETAPIGHRQVPDAVHVYMIRRSMLAHREFVPGVDAIPRLARAKPTKHFKKQSHHPSLAVIT